MEPSAMEPEKRVGTAERQAAIEALGAHARAGRLTGAEYEERSETAKNAITWGDLTGLFSDLPEPHPATNPVVHPAAQPEPAAPARRNRCDPHGLAGSEVEAGRGLIPAPYGPLLVSLSPFIALALFLVTYRWWWFLLIPVMSLLVYGPREHRKR